MERYQGLRQILPEAELLIIPMEEERRRSFYREHLQELRQHTAVFAVSDYYALDLMSFLGSHGIRVPEDISVMGFDDSPMGRMAQPALTIVSVCIPHQILGLYTEDAATIGVGAGYLRIYAISLLPLAVNTMFATLLRCREKQ